MDDAEASAALGMPKEVNPVAYNIATRSQRDVDPFNWPEERQGRI